MPKKTDKPWNLSDCRVFFDFDNTITTADVLDDLIQNFSINDDWKALQHAWEVEEISARECLTGQIRGLRISRDDLNKYLTKVKLDPGFGKLLSWLRKQGVEPVIVTDNFGPIVAQILKHNDIGMTVYANSLGFFNNRLFPSFPWQNPSCAFCAHCKKTHFDLDNPAETRKIIYVGDGRSDICAALESDLVFAKDTLLKYFKKHQRPCVPFATLAQVHEHLKGDLHGAVLAA